MNNLMLSTSLRGLLPGGAASFNITIGDLARRCEMIVINGYNLNQVEANDRLLEGSFFVDVAEGKILVLPPKGRSLASAEIESGRRTRLMEVRDVDGFALRSFTFRQAISRPVRPWIHFDFNGIDRIHPLNL